MSFRDLMLISIAFSLIFIGFKIDRLIRVVKEKQIILNIENLNYDIAAASGSRVYLPPEDKRKPKD